MITTASPQQLLQDLLSWKPDASTDEIRGFHPVFRSMSLDQLSVRLSQALERAADVRGK